MPTGKEGNRFFERMVVLETKVAALMTWQKWQMSALIAILAAIAATWMRH